MEGEDQQDERMPMGSVFGSNEQSLGTNFVEGG